MHEKPISRTLAAILAADLVGYSRLMGEDELGTLRRLKTCRREIIDPAIAAWHGRIVKTTGDGALVEFPSAVEAVACAIQIQKAVARRGEGEAEDKRLRFRIGINVGDIIHDGDDIFGDGVNVAARLQTLCAPGGLCLSRAARDQVRDKLPVAFADLGEQSVKNIARPVRVFGLSPDVIEASPALEGAAPSRRRRGVWAAAALALLAAAGGTAAWWVARTPPPRQELAAAPVASPRASIAVLPLAPGDGSDYFADGLTEDIIAALGRFRELTVIARGGVFAYKGRNPTPDQVGRDLKVRYVVEGSVRRAAERTRVAVSLTDTARGAVIWSERYDAAGMDLFSVQDQIARQITAAIAVRVTDLELARAVHAPNNLEAYDLVLRGRDLLSRQTRPNNAQARALFERAIELDPSYAPAYVGLARVNITAVQDGWTPNPSASLERAEGYARKAIALDPLSAGAHAVLGRIFGSFGEYDQAIAEIATALELNGSDADAYSALCPIRLWRGEIAEARAACEFLARLQPNLATGDAFYLGLAYLLGDRGADAVRVLERSLEVNREHQYVNILLAGAYAAAGRQTDAERQAGAVRQRFPHFSLEQFGSVLRDASQREKLIAALRQAGL
jgi:adenylate cyclase